MAFETISKNQFNCKTKTQKTEICKVSPEKLKKLLRNVNFEEKPKKIVLVARAGRVYL